MSTGELLELAEGLPEAPQFSDAENCLSPNEVEMLSLWVCHRHKKLSEAAANSAATDIDELHHTQRVMEAIRKRCMKAGHPPSQDQLAAIGSTRLLEPPSAALSAAPTTVTATNSRATKDARTDAAPQAVMGKGSFLKLFSYIFKTKRTFVVLPEVFCPLTKQKWQPMFQSTDFIEGAITKKISFAERVRYSQRKESAAAAARRQKDKDDLKVWSPKLQVDFVFGDVLSLWHAEGLWVLDGIQRNASGEIWMHVQEASSQTSVPADISKQFTCPPQPSARHGLDANFPTTHLVRADYVCANWKDIAGLSDDQVALKVCDLALALMANARRQDAFKRASRRKTTSMKKQAAAKGQTKGKPASAKKKRTPHKRSASFAADMADSDADSAAGTSAEEEEEEAPALKRVPKVAMPAQVASALQHPTTLQPPEPTPAIDEYLEFSEGTTASATPVATEETWQSASQVVVSSSGVRGRGRRRNETPMHWSLSPSFIEGVMTAAAAPYIGIIQRTTAMLDSSEKHIMRLAETQSKESKEHEALIISANKEQSERLAEMVKEMSAAIKDMITSTTQLVAQHQQAMKEKDQHMLNVLSILQGKK